jgi:hypothetical protein
MKTPGSQRRSKGFPLRLLMAIGLGLILLRGVSLLGELRIAQNIPFALLRVSFRFRPPLLEECRLPTPAEQEKLPIHMRAKEICNRRFTPYQLIVSIEGEKALSRELLPRGVQHDRPLGIFEDLSLSPGRHTIEVILTPLGERGETLRFQGEADFSPGEIILLSLTDDHNFYLKKRDTKPAVRP